MTVTKPISLRTVIDEMDVLVHEYTAYLNKRTGELITLPDEVLSAAEEVKEDDFLEHMEWPEEMIQKARAVVESGDWLRLPDRFEIHEYRIMEDFCNSIEDPSLGAKLLQTIRSSGAFRRFKDAIHSFEIQDDWYRFRNTALERIAIEWLEAHEIPYTKDI